MVQNCWTRVGEDSQLRLHSTSSVFSVRTSLKPAPLWAKWAVLALVVGLGSQVGTWAAHHDDHRGRCTPCNSTVEVSSSELPAVGFICPNAPLYHPYTCLVFFRDPHNLTIHLHHFYPDHMSVVLCSTMYYDSWPALAGEEDRLCVSLQQLARFRDVDHPVYLNISTLPMEAYGQAFLPHHPNTGRRGFNFTYEMRSWGDAEPAVSGLDHAHLGDCSYNGVPVLHHLSNRKFRYSCQCSAGARGDHCHLGGLCSSSRDPRSWCSYHGQCRFIAGESICACAEGYYGAICQYHFTTIPSYDKTCGGLRHCHHNCHLRVEAQARHAYCSCTAGYLPSNTTHCVAQEDWDVSVSLRLRGGPLYAQDHLLNKTLRVVAATGGSSAVVRNLTVTSHQVPITSRPGGGGGGGGEEEEEEEAAVTMVVVEVSVEGTTLARRLTQTTPWRREFGGGAVGIVATRLPQLSVGPVWAESGSEAALVLSCPVYGGPHLQLTWYKDQTVIYKHNVSYCSFEGQTPRLHVVAERGASDHECTVMVWVYRPQREDHGTYVCHVVDRGYQATQMVVAGVNQSLQLELMPRVLTINQGDDVTLSCVTKNRGWADPDHYQASWRLQPPPRRRAYGAVTHTHIRRRGSLIHVFNVTESLNLTCTMKEKEGVVWMPQDVDGAEAQASAVVRVLIPGAPACPDDLAYGVTWRRTPAGERDEAPCPRGYRGEAAARYCRNQRHPDPRRPAPIWDVPDFSGCTFEPLVYIRTPLYLNQRGYNSLPDDVESLAKDLLTVLRERVLPVLPGEGSSVIDIMEMLEATERGRSRSSISLPVFLGILQAMVAHRGALSSTDTWRMLQLTRKYLRTMLESSSSKDESVRLPNVAAEVQQLHQGQEPVLTVVSNPKTPSEDDSLWLMKVTVEVAWTDSLRTEDPPNEEIERESLLQMEGLPEEVEWQQGQQQQQRQEEEEEEEETVVVGVVTFAHLPVSRSEGIEEPVWVGAPLVEVLAVSRHHPPTTPTRGPSAGYDTADHHTTHTHGSSGTPGTDAHSTVSHLVYFDCTQRPHWLENRSEEGPWVSGCGRVAMVGGALEWDLGPCSTVEAADGGPEGGRCECLCRGPGLYSLLLVPPSPPEVRQLLNPLENRAGRTLIPEPTNVRESVMWTGQRQRNRRLNQHHRVQRSAVQHQRPEKIWWTGDQAVLGSCVASLVVVVACVLLQLPRASRTTVQLRILKCLSLGGLDLTFVVFALWPASQGVHEGVLVAGSACLMLCVGVGVSEQVALHQQLALTPYTTPISPAHLTTIMVLVLSVVVGVMVGAVQRLHHYHLGPPWLPLGVAWGLTAAVLSSLAALSLLWAALTGHNLRRLALIKAATPSHRNLTLVEGRVRQMVVVMGGEWTLIFTSLFQHHPVGRYLFCLATVAQSVVTLVVYACAGDDLGGSRWCRCLPSHRRRPAPDDGEELVMEGGEAKGCMGGLMTCRIPPTRTYEVIPGRGSSHDALGFRARGGSLWSQTTTTVVMPEAGEPLHSPRDQIRPTHLHFPESRKRLSLYARCGSFGVAGAKRPRNLFLRGTDLVCGEDMTSPQGHVLSVSSLTYEDMDPRVTGTKRNLSFSVQQPIIHELPAESKHEGPLRPHARRSDEHDNPTGKYLDMTVTRGRVCPNTENLRSVRSKNGAKLKRSYVNATDEQPRSFVFLNGQVCLQASKTRPRYANVGTASRSSSEKGSNSSHHRYLPMEVKGRPSGRQTLGRVNIGSKSGEGDDEDVGDSGLVGGRDDDVLEGKTEHSREATQTRGKMRCPSPHLPVNTQETRVTSEIWDQPEPSQRNQMDGERGGRSPTDVQMSEGSEGNPPDSRTPADDGDLTQLSGAQADGPPSPAFTPETDEEGPRDDGSAGSLVLRGTRSPPHPTPTLPETIEHHGRPTRL